MRFNRLIAAPALVLLAACGSDTGSGLTGKTKVLLTDSPFPYHNISRVDVHIVRVQVAASMDTIHPQHWTTIAEPNRTINLLELQSGKTTILGETEVDAQSVGAVRVVLNTSLSSITDNAGRKVNVHWPVSTEITIHSYVEASLGNFAPGTPHNLVIDFDVGRSFEDVLGDGSLIFIPWIRAVNEAGAGAVAGVVRRVPAGGGAAQPLENVAVTVLAGDPKASPYTWWKIATGKTEAQGRYRVAFILPGTYIVRAEPLVVPRPGCRDITGVLVSSSETRTLDIDLQDGPGTCGRLTSGGGGPDTTGTGGPGGTGGGTTGGAVASVTVTVWPQSPVVGDSAGAYANLGNASGSALYDRQVTWAVENPNVIEVKGAFGQSLVLRAKSAGTTTITATSEGVSGSRTVTVK